MADAPPVARDLNLVFAGETLVVAFLLIAVTLAMHGFGMLVALKTHNRLRQRLVRFRGPLVGMVPLIVGSWLILVTHLGELAVWALLVRGLQALPDFSDAFYFAILEYTTVGSRFTLPDRWRGLEGAIAMDGLLSFAWSTAVLISMALKFERRYLRERDPG